MKDLFKLTGKGYMTLPDKNITFKINPEGEITEVSDTFFEYFQHYSYQYVVGKCLDLIIEYDIPIEAYNDRIRTLGKGKNWFLTLKILCDNGQDFWVDAHYCPCHENNQFVGFTVIWSTVSEPQIEQAVLTYQKLTKGELRLHDGLFISRKVPNPMFSRIFNGAGEHLLNILGTVCLLQAITILLSMLFDSPKLILSIFALLISLMMGAGLFYLHKNNRQNIHKILKILDSIRCRDYQCFEQFESGSYFASIFNSVRDLYLQTFSDNIRNVIKLNELSRLKTAVDGAKSCIMIADQKGVIKYMNHSLYEMFQSIEKEIQQVIPLFKVDEIVGKNFDVFHQVASHQRDIVDKITKPYYGCADISHHHHIIIIVTPVFNHQGKRIGTTVEWNNATDQLRHFEEVINTVQLD